MATSRIATVDHGAVSMPHPGVGHEAILFVLTLAAAMPLLASALGEDQASRPLAVFAPLLESRLYRQLSGGLGLGLIVFQASLASRRRLAAARPGMWRRWEGWHRHAGVPLLLVALAHTGGRAGLNLNRLLLLCLLGMVLLTQASHVMKAYLWSRAHHAERPRAADLQRDEAANSAEGWLHQAGLQTHVMLATALAILLLAHVWSVYYF
jgi:hypothetical protein